MYIPWALAYLGDNPMQSELTSHIGMQGKHFCRVCKVEKGIIQDDNSLSEAHLRAFLTVRFMFMAVSEC